MTNFNCSLKPGHRVKFIDGSFGDSEKFPLWGGRHGKIAGTVQKVFLDEHQTVCNVLWDNGELRKLLVHRLERLSWKKRVAARCYYPAHRIAKFCKRYAGIVALIMVIDYFILDGKIASKMKRLIDKTFTTTEAKISGTE